MGVFQSPDGQWFRGPDDDVSADQDPTLLSRGIVRSPTGDFMRVPLTSLSHWQDPTPEPEPIAQQAPAPDPEEGVRFTDYARSIMAGGAQIAQGVGWLARMGGAEDIGRTIEELGSDAVDYWNEGLSEPAKDALSREFIKKNEMGEWEWGDANLNTVGLFGAQSLLGTAAGAGVGAGITKVLQVFANPVARTALTKAVDTGLKSTQAAAAGDVVAQAAVKTGQAAAKKLQVIDRIIGAGGFGLGEGAIGGMTAGVNVYESVLSMPAEKLVANERYQQIFNSTDESMSELERHQYAAETVAREASSLAGLQAGLTTALLGAPMGAFFGSILGKKALGAMAQTTPRAITTGAAGEAAQEFLQGGAEQMIANRQLQQAGDTDRDLFEGVLNQAIGGALAGAPLGGAMGTMDVQRGGGAQASAPSAGSAGSAPSPKMEPLRAAAMEAHKAGVPKEEILETIQRVKRGEEQLLVAVGKLRTRAMAPQVETPQAAQEPVQATQPTGAPSVELSASAPAAPPAAPEIPNTGAEPKPPPKVLFETVPSKATKAGQKISELSLERRQEFARRAAAVINHDELAEQIGMPKGSKAEAGRGMWQGQPNPGLIETVAGEGVPREKVEQMARAIQYVHQQDEVLWYRPHDEADPARKAELITAGTHAPTAYIELEHELSTEEQEAFDETFEQAFGELSYTAAGTQVITIDFSGAGAAEWEARLDQFNAAAALRGLPVKLDASTVFIAETGSVKHDWQADQSAGSGSVDALLQAAAGGSPAAQESLLRARAEAARLEAEYAGPDEEVTESTPGAGAEASEKAPALLSRRAPPRDPQTDTPEFKRWFGDSKVVDEAGRPMVLYHGTDADFDRFSATDEGIFFSPSAEVASKYAQLSVRGGANVIPAYLSLRNPLIVDAPNDGTRMAKLAANYYDRARGELQERARSGGHDGIIIREKQGRRDKSTYIAFRPEQIKSEIGNRGTFDPNDPNILLSKKPLPEGIDKIAKHLTPEERAKLRADSAARLMELFEQLPAEGEFEAAALAGEAKRGWYVQSTRAIRTIFGDVDAPRFAALLAAMSPQTSVETNLFNALNTWKNWVRAGRPTDREAIIDIMGQSVQGSKGRDSVLGAWVNNSLRALQSPNPGAIILSGPKVNSFMKNLLGNMQEVTNDAWMANFALVDQTIFSGSLNVKGTDPGKGTGYLAMNAKVRKVAQRLGWTPAEVQETIWSWAKTAYETADAAGETRSVEQLVKQHAISDAAIGATPDFGTLFTADKTVRGILEEAGYGQALEVIEAEFAGSPRGDRQPARTGSDKGARKSERDLVRAAQRLDALRAKRTAERESPQAPLASVPGDRREAVAARRIDESGKFHGLSIAPITEDLKQQSPPGSALLPGLYEVSFDDLELPTPVDNATRSPKLAEEIAKSGRIVPVLVERDANGVLHVREGLHRAHALAILGHDSIPAKITAPSSASRATPAGGQLARAVQAKLDAAIAEVAPLINVTIAQNPRAYGLPADTEGAFMHDQGVVLFANSLPPGRELEVFAHEIFGHFAMERTPFGQQAVDMVLQLRNKRHASIEPLWNEVASRWGNVDQTTHAKEVIAVMAERGDKHALMTRLIAGVRRFLRKLGIVRDYSESEVRDLIARAARALRADANAGLKGVPKLQALNPSSSDEDILAALDEAFPADVVALDAHLSRPLMKRWVGKGYRALNYNPPRGASVADVVRYETEELGNNDIGEKAAASALRLGVDLSTIPAQDAIWVTKTKKEARQYGSDEEITEIDGIDGWEVLVDLGEEGALVVRPRTPLLSRAAPADPSIQAIMDRVLAKTPEEFTLKDRARQMWADIRNTQSLAIKQGLIDSFASIEALEKDFTGGHLLDASQSAHKAALATKNLPSVMAAVMIAGAPNFVNGAYVPVPGRKGIIDIFRPLTEHKDGNLLRQWELFAAANRANRLMQEGRENLFTQAEINTALQLEQKYPVFRQVLNEWNTFNKQMLDVAQDAGVLDPSTRALWERNDYVPFYRAIEEIQQGPGKKKGLSGQKARINKLKGGDEILGNVFENMMMNTAHLLDASFKNRAMQRVVGLGVGTALDPVPFEAEAIKFTDEQLAKALSKAGLVVLAPRQGPNGQTIWLPSMTPQQKAQWSTLFRRVAPTGKDIVSVMVNGKPEYYRVTDPLVLSSITAMGHDNFADVWGLFRGSKKLLTSAITADPAFMLANFVRDTLSNWVVSNASMHPFVDAIKGVKATLANDPVALEMMMAGAGGGGYYDSNPEDIRKLIATKVPVGAKGITDTVIDTPHKAWLAWKKIGSAAENANRIAVFRAVLAKGGTVAEAAYQARDVLNFTMSGDYAAMRWITQTVPFLNARVQGLYRLYRGAKENKRGFILKGGMILAATMALALKNNDDERYDELPEWDKDTYWHLFVGDEHFRIPKPFEVGAMFATIPERFWRAASGRDSFKILGQRLFQMFADTFAFNPVPQLVKPVIEQYANRSMFTGSPIVGMAEQNLQPEAQFTPWTSATMRELADAMPDFAPEWLRSPRRLEAALRAYTGSMGMYVLGASDALVRNAMGYPEEPGRKIYDMPVVQRFMKDPNPRHTKYSDLMYEMLDEANATYSTINRFRREKRFEEARGLQQANKHKLVVRARLNRISTQVRNINQQIRLVQLSGSLSASEKRERIDVLVERKNKVTRQVAQFADLF